MHDIDLNVSNKQKNKIKNSLRTHLFSHNLFLEPNLNPKNSAISNFRNDVALLIQHHKIKVCCSGDRRVYLPSP